MRITGGLVGGRRITAPKDIRPTQDRVKEAYFSKVADMTLDSRFLDLFAGSGAMAIEAWSRGASSCLAVERNRTVLKICDANIEMTGAVAVKSVCADALWFLSKPADKPYELIYADPPYATVDEAFITRILDAIRIGGWLSAYGIVTLERRVGGDSTVPEGWLLMDSRSYGECTLDFYVLS